ncbi:MAG: DUF1697 domain-containing protein [Kutzneria sp.]|nr:DUF1697 domain-containing protein [Kutzneria sp.]MBV9843918.1 DUF1697 domain-containing protein [Kutzneria sp.]
MSKYVALLRGINVGGNKKVPMAQLRELLAGLGLSGVRTLLNSGNAVFAAEGTGPDELAKRIEAAIDQKLGQSVRCLIRDRVDIHEVIEANPFPEAASDGSRFMAVFTSAPLDPDLVAVHDPTTLDPDNIRLGDRVIYQWCRQGVLEAPDLRQFADKHWKVTVTGRNWNTVLKIGALLDT